MRVSCLQRFPMRCAAPRDPEVRATTGCTLTFHSSKPVLPNLEGEGQPVIANALQISYRWGSTATPLSVHTSGYPSLRKHTYHSSDAAIRGHVFCSFSPSSCARNWMSAAE